jgi:hypothetical protein
MNICVVPNVNLNVGGLTQELDFIVKVVGQIKVNNVVIVALDFVGNTIIQFV